MGGRPRKAIGWKQFDQLCAMQCTQQEIAAFFDCSVDTIERAVQRDHSVGFAEYYDAKRKAGLVSLRRAQWVTALSGNVVMLIWLGKQMLGQKEPREEQLPLDPALFNAMVAGASKTNGHARPVYDA